MSNKDVHCCCNCGLENEGYFDNEGNETKFPIVVERFIKSGELEGNEKNASEILESCGSRLDSACSGDILGDVLFLGKDGKYYVVCVEAVIGEANPDIVKEALKEEACSQCDKMEIMPPGSGCNGCKHYGT